MDDVFRSLSAGVTPAGSGLKKRARSDVAKKLNAEEVSDNTLPSSLNFFSAVGHRETGDKLKKPKAKKDLLHGKEEQRSAREKPEGQLRKKAKVRKERGLPEPLPSFDEWGLQQAFEDITGAGSLTEVQAHAAPSLDAGMEVIAVAPTGSGKTLAYAVPIIRRAQIRQEKLDAPGALILVPTRELAEQVHRVMTRFLHVAQLHEKVVARLLVTKAQVSGLAGGGAARCDILIATPMRLILAIRTGSVNLQKVEDLVLDEADKLFEDGFVEQLDEVLDALGSRRIHMFSATLPPTVERTAQTVMKAPVKISIGAKRYGGGTAAVDSSTIDQKFMFAGGQGEAGKVLLFRRLLTEGLMPPVLVFVQSQDRASQLFKEMIFDGVNIDAIHAGRSQAQREAAIRNFRSGKVWVLIATDLMARGIDFRTVNTVVNYDMPSSAVAYVHRIGRTGRAGKSGTAITFFTEEDKPFLRKIVNVSSASGAQVPAWLLELKPAARHDLKRLEKRPPRRNKIGSASRVGKGGRKKGGDKAGKDTN
mmetsp:Transcript_10634/g.32561  ORF Transcript_10634/g.32561 Transcript_10634/m.32561 type:complete len:533 (+) Transcript_10634:122-1720(+)|eukprot:CAMPEP_0198726304 /NCGR_PEP_ID=MMETSP1475-20131203/3398_1 /TAXON_ID= ORGANISM="Unidentified sp., Strain CCMP1999" /NCGR_SAMPLE_ID=MMETSP1475 /ASSEMBLY_ACC=CAM_ASM_001111 /LENGTH=532 /DNA_ID=CAMNT_0044488211 /DNA_START=53 /DNA_END=1651 /DNA_ORIENTATION=+